MQKPLLQAADNFKKDVLKKLIELWFKKIIKKDEKMDITGSIKYWLALAWESDIDIWIVSKNPRKSFLEKMDYFSKTMAKNKLFKSMIVKNFFDQYKWFQVKKEKLIKAGDNDTFFLIEMHYYADENLKTKFNFQIHIAKTSFVEPFPELLKLSIKERTNLLSLKDFIYKNLPFFWNRPYLLYKWFLAWNTTKKSMQKYLMDNWYKKLIRK